jgi:hypothetical protein
MSNAKFFKPAMYEAGVLDSITHNMVNGSSNEEQIYACRIAHNLCFNSEIRMRNYDKLLPFIK